MIDLLYALLATARSSLKSRRELALEIQVAAPLMQLKGGSSINLSSVGELAAWEAECEHWLSSFLRTGRRF